MVFSHCDRDWEQENQVIIQSLGNPGWDIEIDLAETNLEGLEFEMKPIDVGDHWPSIDQDWWVIKIKENKFSAAGDTKKLFFLLEKFRVLAETGDVNTILIN